MTNHYHQQYSNIKYREIAEAVQRDFATHCGDRRISVIMNRVTDAALGLCGNNKYRYGWRLLAVAAAENGLTQPTVEKISAYLTRFSEDFDVEALPSMFHSLRTRI